MRRIPLVVLGAAAVVVVAAFPARAVTTGDTAVTFDLVAGELAITVPASVDLTGPFSVSDPEISGAIGPVTVDDDRGVDTNWTVEVSSTVFDGDTTTATLPLANQSYAPGTVTPTNVVTTPLDVDPLSATGQLTVSGNPVSAGLNSATWNPTLTITLPTTGGVADTYTGTVTHDVA